MQIDAYLDEAIRRKFASISQEYRGKLCENMEKYFKTINYKNKKYIYNILTFVTEEYKENKELEAFEKEEITFEELSDITRSILEKGHYVRKKILRIQEEQDGFDLVSFSFPPIHECNLRCEYCFANHGENYVGEQREFSDELVIDICNFMIDNYPTTNHFRLDFVSGGEPLLNAKKALHFIKLAREVFGERKKNLFIWLCTNGTTITISDAKELDYLHVRLGISIDGKQEIHDSVRKFADGAGSYDIVVDNVSKIIKNKDLSKQFRQIWALSTITSINHDFISILEHLKGIGFTGVQMKFIRVPKDNPLSLNKDNINDYKKDISLYFDYLYAECCKNDYSSLMLITNDTDFIGKIIKRFFLNMPLANRCYAARSQVSITADGQIFPCASFVGNDKYSIGNINGGFDSKKRSHFMNRTVDQNNICSNCWARYLCTGQCFSNCYYANDDIGMPEELYCQIEKMVIMETINLAGKMTREQHSKIVKMLRLKNFTGN